VNVPTPALLQAQDCQVLHRGRLRQHVCVGANDCFACSQAVQQPYQVLDKSVIAQVFTRAPLSKEHNAQVQLQRNRTLLIYECPILPARQLEANARTHEFETKRRMFAYALPTRKSARAAVALNYTCCADTSLYTCAVLLTVAVSPVSIELCEN